ncbi:MAG: hypothetical protein ACK4ND_01060 [Cytophagaceae bacterium]
MKKESGTFRLFSTSSFLSGVASSINVFGNYYSYNYSISHEEADRKALQSDWNTVGNDVKVALDNYIKMVSKANGDQLDLKF